MIPIHTTDSALDRCGNCRLATWENHEQVRCGECGDVYRLCPLTCIGCGGDHEVQATVGTCAHCGGTDIDPCCRRPLPDDCSQHPDDLVFASETDADRQAAWAAARGL